MEDKVVIAKRVALELKDGNLVNLGIGLPTMVPQYLPPEMEVYFQSENGIIGMAQVPGQGMEDPSLTDAGGGYVGAIPGAASIDSALSFGLIRGGHLDITVLGGLEVDEQGQLANWIVPGKMVPGMGGAMDLVTGAKIVHIVTEHCARDGSTKLMKRCTFPLTGAKEADVIITERALFRRFPGKGWVLEEVAAGYSLDDIAGCTHLAYTVADNVKLDAYGGEEIAVDRASKSVLGI